MATCSMSHDNDSAIFLGNFFTFSFLIYCVRKWFEALDLVVVNINRRVRTWEWRWFTVILARSWQQRYRFHRKHGIGFTRVWRCNFDYHRMKQYLGTWSIGLYRNNSKTRDNTKRIHRQNKKVRRRMNDTPCSTAIWRNARRMKYRTMSTKYKSTSYQVRQHNH